MLSELSHNSQLYLVPLRFQPYLLSSLSSLFLCCHSGGGKDRGENPGMDDFWSSSPAGKMDPKYKVRLIVVDRSMDSLSVDRLYFIPWIIDDSTVYRFVSNSNLSHPNSTSLLSISTTSALCRTSLTSHWFDLRILMYLIYPHHFSFILS